MPGPRLLFVLLAPFSTNSNNSDNRNGTNNNNADNAADPILNNNQAKTQKLARPAVNPASNNANDISKVAGEELSAPKQNSTTDRPKIIFQEPELYNLYTGSRFSYGLIQGWRVFRKNLLRLGSALQWLYTPKGYRVIKSGFSVDYYVKKLAGLASKEVFLNFGLNLAEKYFLIGILKNTVSKLGQRLPRVVSFKSQGNLSLLPTALWLLILFLTIAGIL